MSAPLIPVGDDDSASGNPSAEYFGRAEQPEIAGTPEVPARRGRHSTTASSRLALILVTLLAASGIFLGGYTLGAHVATTPGTPAGEESRFQPFWDVYSLIQNSFAGSPKPSPDALVRAAISGMMQSLNDPYSYYQAPADFQNTLQNVGGQAVGVGIQVELEPVDPAGTQECTTIGGGCQLAVVEPIPGSPADKAGVKAGDFLVSVNGTTLDGLTVDQASTLIKGAKGTKATLQIDRAGQRLEIAVIRDVFDLLQVATKSLAGGKVAYISLSQFGDAAAAQFHGALAAALKAGAQSIIVDLRGNPGGLVTGADAIASEFISSGTIVYQIDAAGTETAISAKTGGLATDPAIKVAVLVDKNSASASEILAGALQARGRAVLVGEHTFGKGIFQEYLPLSNNAGGIHLTTGQWLTPNHVSIQGKGLQPDVPATSTNARAGQDPVLDAALVKLGYPAESTASPGPSAVPSAGPSPSPSPSASATSS